MVIWWLTDDKAGHVAQARGLFAALLRCNIDCHIVELPVEQLSKKDLLMRLLKKRFTRSGAELSADILANHPAPDLLVAVGHVTHIFLILLQKLYPNSRSVLLMKPSLPLSWFDLAIVPQHDQPVSLPSIFVSQGVLNPLTNEQRHQPDQQLILIGGASKRHGFDADALAAQLQQLVQQQPQQIRLLTTSRRTPTDFLADPRIQNLSSSIEMVSVEHTPQGWLAEQLQQAESVWVTEDSVSMMYEALTAGCVVGVLAMPRLKQDRITQSIDRLIAEQNVITLNQSGTTTRQRHENRSAEDTEVDHQHTALWSAHEGLAEADRAAAWLLQQMEWSIS